MKRNELSKTQIISSITFQPLGSGYRDPQLQMGKKYQHSLKLSQKNDNVDVEVGK